MEECVLNVRISTKDEISVDSQIELVKIIRARLAEVLPEDSKVLVGRKVSNEEIMNALR